MIFLFDSSLNFSQYNICFFSSVLIEFCQNVTTCQNIITLCTLSFDTTWLKLGNPMCMRLFEILYKTQPEGSEGNRTSNTTHFLNDLKVRKDVLMLKNCKFTREILGDQLIQQTD